MRRRIATLLAAGLFALAGAAGCGEDDVEQSVDRARDEAGEAAGKAGKAAEDARNKAEGAARDAGDAVKKEADRTMDGGY
jgi:hypothetical protein